MVLSIGEFARGPSQAVNLLASNLSAGIPVQLSGGSSVSNLSFTLRFDPARLSISGVSKDSAPALANAVLTADLRQAGSGLIDIQLTGLSGLPSAALTLLHLQASVPSTATYGAKHLLDIQGLQFNQGDLAGLDDDGMHVVAYLGDTEGQPRYSAADALRVQRVVARLDTGFSAYPLVDPLIVGDVNSNGRLDATDALLIQRKVVRLPVPELPDLPSPVPVVSQLGPDPALDIPDGLTVQAGQRITVPITLDTAEGLDSAQLQVRYDASVLEVEGVRPGTLTGDFQAFLVVNEPGQLQLDLARLAPLAGGTGSLVEIDLRAKADATPGRYALDLEWASLSAGRLVLTPQPVPGLDGTDGSLNVVANPAAQPKVANAPKAPKATAPLVPQLGPIEPSARAGAQRGTAAAIAPVIDWTAPAAPRPAAVGPLSQQDAVWAKDFVLNLGQNDEQRNPNDKLRLPAALAVSGKVKPKLQL